MCKKKLDEIFKAYNHEMSQVARLVKLAVFND